jgi:hypothetical protein
MQKLFSSLLILIAITTITSCNKEKNEVDYFWKETWCANPWNDDSDSIEVDVKTDVIDYLASENVEAKEITIEYIEEQVAVCLACFCLTGNNIIVTIDTKDEEKIIALGFEKHE